MPCATSFHLFLPTRSVTSVRCAVYRWPNVTMASGASASSPAGVMAMLFDRLPQGQVLNLGSGATSHLSPSRISIDVDRRLPLHATSGTFVVADAAALPFRSGAFHGALLKDILEHTQDPIEVLIEVRRTCSGGARIVITVPRAIPRAVWADPTHLRGFTAKALLRTLGLSGWQPAMSPRRLGGFPGAGRLRLNRHLLIIMRVPILGHWLGTNWIIDARPAAT